MEKIKKVLGHIKENIGMLATEFAFLSFVLITYIICSNYDNLTAMDNKKHNDIINNLETQTVVMTIVEKSNGEHRFKDVFDGHELKVVDENNREYSTNVNKDKFYRFAVGDKLAVEVVGSQQGNILEVYTYWDVRKINY